MDEKTIYVKTERGREEIRTRELKLSAPARTLLIATDGLKTTGTLARLFPVVDGVGPLLQTLLDAGLVEPIDGATPAPAAVIAAPPADDFERFRLAAQMFNESTKLLGFGAFLFSLKIQRCATLDDLRKLVPELRSAVGKRQGEATAESLMRQLHALLG